MQSDRVRIKKTRFYGPQAPAGQVVVGYNPSQSSEPAGLECLPPFVSSGRLIMGTVVTGVTWDGGGRPRAGTGLFSGALGQSPAAAISNDLIYGLDRPIHRPAIVRGFPWSSCSGAAYGGGYNHLVRLDANVRATAAGANEYVTPAYGLSPWNRAVFGRGASDLLMTFTVATDGTAAFEAARSIAFGSTPNGIGAVVVTPSGTKALVFGRDLENRNQIAQTTDTLTYAALPEAVISAGNPIKICDALALPAAGIKPATVLALGILNGTSGAARVLRSTDDGVSFALLPLGTSTSTFTTSRFEYVNGVLFVYLNSDWYYSLDHGATFTRGSTSVSGVSRVDYDAVLRCYILHLRLGAIAIFDNDLSYLGTLIIPPSDQLITAAFASVGSLQPVSFAARGFACGTYYNDGVLYGLAFAGAVNCTLVYALRLHIQRLPNGEPATVQLKGGGGYGELSYTTFEDLNTLRLEPSTDGFTRIPASATRLLGYASAGGADGARGEEKFLNMRSAPAQIPAGLEAKGGAGLEMNGRIVGEGGMRSHQGLSATVSEHAFITGGRAGGDWTGATRPGALLVFEVGEGGRIERRIASAKFNLYAGTAGGALVEWEEWA